MRSEGQALLPPSCKTNLQRARGFHWGHDKVTEGIMGYLLKLEVCRMKYITKVFSQIVASFKNSSLGCDIQFLLQKGGFCT